MIIKLLTNNLVKMKTCNNLNIISTFRSYIMTCAVILLSFGLNAQCSIEGDTSVCADAVETYNIAAPPVNTNYTWSAVGGTINGSSVGTSVEVIWDAGVLNGVVSAEGFMTTPASAFALNFNTECIDLDVPSILAGCGATGDISFLAPNFSNTANGATQVLLADTNFADITVCDLPGLTFLSLTVTPANGDVVIVNSGSGSYFKLGNFVNSATNMTFDMAPLSPTCGGGETCELNVEMEEDVSLGCNDLVNISLDETCIAALTPSMLLEGETFPDDSYSVVVYNKNGTILPNATLTKDHIKMTLDYRVIHLCTGNTCWGRLYVEDKQIPDLECDDAPYLGMCGEDLSPEVIGFPVPGGVTAVKDLTKVNTYILSGFDPCGIAYISYDEIINLNRCDDEFYKEIIRVWKAWDESGNMTPTCTTYINVERGSLAGIVWPVNFDGIANFHLECDYRDKVHKDIVSGLNEGWNSIKTGQFAGNPSPYDLAINARDTLIGTGYPGGAECDHIAITFKDRRIETCSPLTYKLFRTWKAFDWCTGELLEHLQVIKVADTKAPQVVCPTRTPMVTPTSPWKCTGSLIVPPPIFNPNFPIFTTPLVPVIIQECTDWSYTIEHFVSAENTMSPDDCGAVDLTQTFNTNNVRKLPNGSWEVFDMPQGCNWIKYYITDDCGNTTVCGLEVFVEDAGEPVAVCDQHTAVSLNEQGTAQICGNNVDNGSFDNCTPIEDLVFKVKRMGEDDAFFRECVDLNCDDIANNPIMIVFRVFDKAENYNDCMVEVEVQDKIAPEIECPDDARIICGQDYSDSTLTGGLPIVDDQCGGANITRTLITEDIDDCGVGYVIYRWRAEDAGGRFVTCDQRIDIINPRPFSRRNIDFPNDYTVNGCDLIDAHPDNLPAANGWPRYSNIDCAIPVAGYTDEAFFNVGGFCIKIVRTWKVIDWCQYDINNPSSTAGIWEDIQTINIRNTAKPTILAGCDDRTICADDDCDALVEFELSASDDCTPEADLVWAWEAITVPGGVSVVTGNSGDVSVKLGRGQYRFTFKVKDACGNETTCNSDVYVKDCKEPTPYCKPGIITTIMPSTGYVDIWALDFNDGSYDNCTDTAALRYSFSSDLNDIGRRITCDSMDQATDTFEYRMWVTDLDGNQDFCTVKLIVQDNQNRCGFGTVAIAAIGGVIMTITDEEVEAVEVDLMRQTTHMDEMMTPKDGAYAFYNLQLMGEYSILPIKNDDAINGVSTADLVMIQRHLLGMNTFNEAYQYIAADANNSQSISAADISALRKLVLGVYNEFQNNTSWRFVDATYVFPDQTNPWIDPIPEAIRHDSLRKDEMETNFLAIKVGDVNNDAVANGFGTVKTRSQETVSLELSNEVFTTGELVSVDVTVSEALALDGIQFTLETNDLSFEGATSAKLNVNEANFGMLATGLITFSWGEVIAADLNANDVLFTLEFTATANSTIQNSIELNSSVTVAEAYVNGLNNADLELTIRNNESDISDELTLYQNIPNPFSHSTTIGFELSENAQAELNVFDVTGKVILVVHIEGKKGYNSVDLDVTQLTEAGVLYYQLESNQKVATRKMLLIK